MSTVVIRCPNCGTTQPTLGECDACHHADTGYYCTNHAPGRFIAGATCPDCGATHGVESPPVPRPHRSTPSRSASAPVTWGPPPEPPRAPDRDEWIIIDRSGRSDEAGAFPARRDPGFGTIDPADAAAVVARGAVGCFGRLVMTAIVMVVLVLVLVFGFVGGLFGAVPASARDDAQRVPSPWLGIGMDAPSRAYGFARANHSPASPIRSAQSSGQESATRCSLPLWNTREASMTPVLAREGSRRVL